MAPSATETHVAKSSTWYLNEASSMSPTCLRMVLKDTKFKQFLQHCAEIVPKELSPLLKGAISIVDNVKKVQREAAAESKRKRQLEEAAAETPIPSKKSKQSIAGVDDGGQDQDGSALPLSRTLRKLMYTKRRSHTRPINEEPFEDDDDDNADKEIEDISPDVSVRHDGLVACDSQATVDVDSVETMNDDREGLFITPPPNDSRASTLNATETSSQVTRELDRDPTEHTVALVQTPSTRQSARIQDMDKRKSRNSNKVAENGSPLQATQLHVSSGLVVRPSYITAQVQAYLQKYGSGTLSNVSPDTSENDEQENNSTSSQSDQDSSENEADGVPKPSNTDATMAILSPKTKRQRYAVETGITMGSDTVISAIKVECRQWTQHADGDRQLAEVFQTCQYLEFYQARAKLVSHLRSRKGAGGAGIKMEMPTTWDMVDESSIVDAIKTIGDHNEHAKIQKAYAQMRLYKLVQSKIKSSKTIIRADGEHVAEHRVVLSNMSKAKTADLSEEMKAKFKAAHQRAYTAGEKWTEACQWFGGEGIVLVFVAAEIGSSLVEFRWLEFQRKCFSHIAQWLPSISRLVKTLNDNVLEDYCKHGSLSEDLVEKIAEMQGYL